MAEYNPPFLLPEETSIEKRTKQMESADLGVESLTDELAGTMFLPSSTIKSAAAERWEREEATTRRTKKRIRAEMLAELEDSKSKLLVLRKGQPGDPVSDANFYSNVVLKEPQTRAEIEKRYQLYRQEEIDALAQSMVTNVKRDQGIVKQEVIRAVKGGGEVTRPAVVSEPHQKIKQVYGGEGQIQLFQSQVGDKEATPEELRAAWPKGYQPKYGLTDPQARLRRSGRTEENLTAQTLFMYLTRLLPAKADEKFEAELENLFQEVKPEARADLLEKTRQQALSMGQELDEMRAQKFVGIPSKAPVFSTTAPYFHPLNALSRPVQAVSGALAGAVAPLFEAQKGSTAKPLEKAFVPRPYGLGKVETQPETVAGVDVEQAYKDISSGKVPIAKVGASAAKGAYEAGVKGYTGSLMEAQFMAAQDKNLDATFEEVLQEQAKKGVKLDPKNLIELTRERAKERMSADVFKGSVEDPASGELMIEVALDPLTLLTPAKLLGWAGKIGKLAGLEPAYLSVAKKVAKIAEDYRYQGPVKSLVADLRAADKLTPEEAELLENLWSFGDQRAQGVGVLYDEFASRVAKSAYKRRIPGTELGQKFSPEEMETISGALHGKPEAMSTVLGDKKLQKAYESAKSFVEEDRSLRQLGEGAHQLVPKEGQPGAGIVQPMRVKKEAVGEFGYAHPHVLQETPGVSKDLVKELNTLGYDSVEDALKSLDNIDHPMYTSRSHLSKEGLKELRALQDKGGLYEAKVAEGGVRSLAKPSSAHARTGSEGYVKDYAEQWKAAILGPKGTKRASQVGAKLDLMRAALESPGEAKKLFYVAETREEAATLARELSNEFQTEFVTLGTTPGGKDVAQEVLRVTSKPGTKVAGKIPVVPKAFRDEALKLFPEVEQISEADKLIQKYFVRGFFEPVMSTWRLSTTAMIPAFHMTNATGAVEMAILADGIKAANPGMHYDAARTAVAAFFNGSEFAARTKITLGGQTMSLRDAAMMAKHDGVLGRAQSRFGEDLGQGIGPFGAIAKGAHTVASATGMKLASTLIDDYQHLTIYLSRLAEAKDLSIVSRMNAANAAAELTGNYGRLSAVEKGEAKLFGVAKVPVPKLFSFYNWNRFYAERTLQAVKSNPARVSFFDKIKTYQDKKNSPAVENSVIPGEALPGWQQVAGVYTAPKEVQQPDPKAGDDRFVVQTFQTPSQYLGQMLTMDPDWVNKQMGPLVQAVIAASTGYDPQTNQPVPEGQDWAQKYGLKPVPAGARLNRLFGLAQKAWQAGRFKTAMDYVDLLYLGNELQFMSPVVGAVTGTDIPWSLGRQNYMTGPDYGRAVGVTKRAEEDITKLNKAEEKSPHILEEE